MKVVVCPDSFKGSLTAKEAAEAMSTGVRDILPDAEIVKLPLSDGGEGLMETLSDVLDGKIVDCLVSGPLSHKKVRGRYLLANCHTAIMEMASASGLTLIPEEDRNPLFTSTFGTGELIAHSIKGGARRLILGLGGSATNDAGMGMLKALGYKFLDKIGRELVGTGADLKAVEKIEKGIDLNAEKVELTGICDVGNPLFGERGAAYVFAPQKGANPEEVRWLDEGLRHYARIFKRDLGVSLDNIRGGGAAGGLGAAVAYLSGGRLYSGIRMVLDLVHFDDRIKGADLIITGEGCVDRQSLMGKVISGVHDRAKANGIPVCAIGGIVKDRALIEREGIKVVAATPSGMDVATAMRKDMAMRNVRSAAVGMITSLFMGER